MPPTIGAAIRLRTSAPTSWLQRIGNNKRSLLGQVEKLIPGDMPDFDPALEMAYKALNDPKKEFAKKHVILISDGDPQQTDPKILPALKAAKTETLYDRSDQNYLLPLQQAFLRSSQSAQERLSGPMSELHEAHHF